MFSKARALRFSVVLVLLCSGAMAPGKGDDTSKAALRDLRRRLGGLSAGMTSQDVLKAIGRPDEVRPVGGDRLLDGSRLGGDLPGTGPETERWAYGVLGKGLFARAGYVAIDRNGKVVAAVPADCFAGPVWKVLDLVTPKGDEAVASPGNLSCRAGSVTIEPRAGESTECFNMAITIKNNGRRRFELKHDAANSPRRFLVVEMYDAEGTLLFRDDEMRYHSPIRSDPADYPVLSIKPGREIAIPLSFLPAHGFGSFPPGRYSLRVYFPFEEWRYYPSNAVRFEIKEGQLEERRK